MSIRLRLTLLYSTILALTLIAFSLVLYGMQARYTLNVQKRDLESIAQRVTRGIARARTYQDRLTPRPETVNPDRPGPRFGEQELRELRIRDMIRIFDTDGVLIQYPLSEQDEPLPLSDEGLQVVRSGEPWIEIISVEGERLLIHNSPLVVDGQVDGIVQVARSLTDRDRSLKALGGALIVGSLLTTLAAFGIGWVLAGITLRPIHRITQTAQTIGAERDFDRRVEHAGPNDEIGQLATTFNAMLTRLQDAYRQVERSLEVQRQLVADVSHELRTPLTTIRGNLALLRRQPPIQAEEREDVLADMVDESERLIRLVNDLLTLARIDAGRQLQSKAVWVKPLVQDVCRQARLLDSSRTIVCDPLPDVAVIVDPDAFKQVLLILLDNALKHTDGDITITTETTDPQGLANPSGLHRAIRIHDAGPGMDAATCTHIFDRFYRGSEAHTTPGFGLGLPIAKTLIEAQNGTITVESEVGRGSTFTVTLPQATAPSEGQ